MADRQKALSVNRFEGVGRLLGCFLTLFGIAFCTIFFFVGSMLFYVGTLSPLLESMEANSWVATPCTILSSKVRNNDSRSLEISYQYTYEGQQFQSSRYAISPQWSGDRVTKERIVAKYKEGTEQTCYVDPGNPSDAVLNRETEAVMWFGLFGLPFMFVGLVGYWFVFFGRKKLTAKIQQLEQKATAATLSSSGRPFGESPPSSNKSFEVMSPLREASQKEWGNSDFDEEDLFEDPGPVALKPESSKLGAAIGLFVFALFWNGIVAIITVAKISDDGLWEWSNLFFVPFVTIGIGVLLAAVYTFLATLNPKPELVLSRQLIPLGGSARLQWRFTEGTGSIRNIKILLVGEEEARYRRGTTTHTDTEKFYEEILYETTVSLEMQSGEVDVSIPTDTMHTFAGGNNKITWNVAIKGDIPLWPDVNEEFPIRVVPHE